MTINTNAYEDTACRNTAGRWNWQQIRLQKKKKKPTISKLETPVTAKISRWTNCCNWRKRRWRRWRRRRRRRRRKRQRRWMQKLLLTKLTTINNNKNRWREKKTFLNCWGSKFTNYKLLFYFRLLLFSSFLRLFFPYINKQLFSRSFVFAFDSRFSTKQYLIGSKSNQC